MIWVVHPDPRIQRFLARLLGEAEALCGDAGDAGFETAVSPRAIVLGVVDPGPALEFAQRAAERHPRARWVLVRDPELDDRELARLFAGLDAARLAYPPEPAALRAALRPRATDEAGETLPERRRREAVRSRFARYFEGLALPEPQQVQRAGRGLIVRGERGTGRLLFARAAHLLAGGDRFVHFPCDESTETAGLAAQLRAPGETRNLTVCLEGLDRVVPAVQRELLGWIELGAPAAALPPEDVRWIALVSESGALLPELADALAGPEVHLPPLRDRPGAVAAFVRATAEPWAADRGLERSFSEQALQDLAARPWPGNLRELEAAVLRLLSSAQAPVVDVPHVTALLAEPGVAPARQPAPAPAQPPSPIAAAPAVPQAPASPAIEPAAARQLEPRLRALVACLSHELRNPLTSIRNSAALLPERYADPEFRGSYHDHVQRDVATIHDRLARLTRFADLRPGPTTRVDVSALLERMLEERRDAIRSRRLLVLRELETERPVAMADEQALVFAFGCLLDRIVRESSLQADLYVATRHHQAADGTTSLRILFRYHDGGAAGELATARHSLDLWLAEEALALGGGDLHVDSGAGEETVVLIELSATG